MKKYCKLFLLLPVCMAIVILGWLIFRKDMILEKAAVKERYTLLTSHFMSWEGAEIHYTDHGSGIPLLMIHGLGGSIWDFRYLDSAFYEKYRVIRVDMPGFGLSDYPENSPSMVDTYNDYFKWLIDTLHLDSMYVMGNSMGGMMAWNIANTYPEKVRKLILFNSAGYDIPATLKATNAYMLRHNLLQWYLKKGIPKTITKRGMHRTLYNSSPLMTEENIQRFNDMWNREGNLEHIIRVACTDDYPSSDSIKNVQCPTLIIWGKYDIIIPVKYAYNFKNDIKNSTLIVYDSCGHVPMLEAPDRVIKDVTVFLEKN